MAPPTARDVNSVLIIHGYLHSLLNILLLHARVCASEARTVKHKHSILESSVSYALESIILVLPFRIQLLFIWFWNFLPFSHQSELPLRKTLICKILHDVILLTSSLPASIATTLLDFLTIFFHLPFQISQTLCCAKHHLVFRSLCSYSWSHTQLQQGAAASELHHCS